MVQIQIDDETTVTVKQFHKYPEPGQSTKPSFARVYVRTRHDGIVCVLFRNQELAMCFTDDPTPTKKRRPIHLGRDATDALVALAASNDEECYAAIGHILLRYFRGEGT